MNDEKTLREEQDEITVKDIIDQMLTNQEVIMSSLIYLIKSSGTLTTHSEARDNVNNLADEYNRTRYYLGKDYVRRWR